MTEQQAKHKKIRAKKVNPFSETELMFSNNMLKRLIIPLVFEQLLSISIGFFDTIMVSSIGESAVSGTSLVDMINVLIINMFASIATGGAVIAAQYIGKRDKEKACNAANQLVTLILFISTAVAILCVIFRKQLLHLFFGTIDTDVMNYCLDYFLISSISYPFIAVYNAGASIFRAMGNSKISMFTSFIMNILNISGNAIFIYALKLEVKGAATASMLSRVVACFFVLIMAGSKKNYVSISIKGMLNHDTKTVKKILKIGLPGGIETGIFQLGRILVVSIISTFGTVQITANAIANNIDSMGTICGNAMNLAIITVIGQCLGAANIIQAEYYAKKLMKITYALTAGVNSLLLISLPLLLKFYNLSEETTILAAILICIHDGLAIILWPASFSLPNILKAGGDAKFTMITAVFSMFVFRLGISIFLARRYSMGAIGVWIGMIIDWIFRSAVFFIRYKKGNWKRNKVI